MKTLRYILFMIIALATPEIAKAQELKVVSFEKLLTDVTARSTAVKDGNGDICALIKVSLPVEGCEFAGNIVGKPEFHVSEYWVYMTPSSKKLIIRCPGRESLNADFGIAVESAVTYQLRLSGYPDIAGNNATADPGANYLILDITPKTGLSVEVDGQLQKVDDGQVMAYLKYGTHRYIVKAEGYAPQEGTATVSRGETTTVSIALESVMGTLSIFPTTSGAIIKLNGQEKGTGNWQGQLTPGIYRVDVEKNGYRSYSETVELAQRDNRTVSVPALAPIYGALNIGYKPIGSSIAIDGKTVGTTPSVISNVLIGKHSITISKEGYASFNTSVDIAEGETTQLAGSLEVPSAVEETKAYDMVDQKPRFPGDNGDWAALQRWLGENIRYPLTAEKNGIQGRVICHFVIERDGSITDIKVVKSVDPSLDAEAVRVIKSMPKWIPGKQNGASVRVGITMPLVFRLK